MLSALAWLALEVKYLPRSREFYEERLGFDPVREAASSVTYRAGDTDLVLRASDGVPRGGLHVHYAFSTPRSGYDAWDRRLSDLDPDEVSFGSYQSLYVDDPDDHCVEVGNNGAEPDDHAESIERGSSGTGLPAPLTGVFEVVLEVESLSRARSFYQSLGFEVVDEGEGRPRTRLHGPFDLELWEPHLGLADARGGVHVDLGFETEDVDAAVDAISDRACSVETVDDGVRVRDPDGHYLTFLE